MLRPQADMMSALHLPVNPTYLFYCDLFPKAAPEQVGHLNEERAAVATKPRLELTGEGIEAVAREVIVVAEIESCAGVWSPAGQELAASI